MMDEIRVPETGARIPRKIASGFVRFTADQWKDWTLIYSSTDLKPLIGNRHYQVWMMFVKAVRMLTKKENGKTDIRMADQLLVTFCTKDENIYREEFIKANFHMACHIAKVMEEYGPVYSFWCYGFER
jgi:hypothetical protein